jgi:hypothetical protein
MNKRVNSKGQVTIFIIIAILVVVFGVLFFVFKDDLELGETPLEIAPIVNFVQECVDDVSEQTIYFIGLHGGYYMPPEKSTDSGIPYYSYENTISFPSKNKMELEISQFIKDSIPNCINNFSNFNDFEIKEGNIDVISEIKEDSVYISVNYPITIKKGEEVNSLKEFKSQIPVRLDIMYETSKFILNYSSKNQGRICLTCLFEFQTDKNIQINLRSIDNGIIYEIVDKESTLSIDKESILEIENYKFNFAIKY